MTHPQPKRKFVPNAVLMKATVPVNIAILINTAFRRPTVNCARPASNDNSQIELHEKEVIDSGCYRHMTGNKSYLTDYEEIDRGFVAFGDDYSRFSWVFFLATKDETSEILKTFITGIENLIDLKVKVIRCDNGTEFKNKVMNQFYEMKGIKREFSVARTPQQNGAEAVNTACYVQNRVLVIKPHNKTPYELFLGRKPALSFMRPFGCPVTILNTLDHLGKFDGKADEGFFVGYSTNSKAFRVFNSRTRVYAATECESDQSLSKGSMDSPDAGFKPSREEGKMDVKHPKNENSEVPNTEEPIVNQEYDESINSTNNINTVSSTVNTASLEDNAAHENIVYGCDDDLNMPNLEEIAYSDDDEEVGAEDDMNNLAIIMPVSPIPTTIVYKDHPLEQIIEDIHSAPQTKRMTKNVTEHDPKKVIQVLQDPSWIEAMQEELLQFKLQQVWTLMDLPHGKRAIGYTQEEGIDYDEVFALVARIEAIRLFLAYASFKDFVMYQMDIKYAFMLELLKRSLLYPTSHVLKNQSLLQISQGKKRHYMVYIKRLELGIDSSTYLLTMDFQRGQIENTCFIKESKECLEWNGTAAKDKIQVSVVRVTYYWSEKTEWKGLPLLLLAWKQSKTVVLRYHIGGVEAQIRFEAASKQSNDPHLLKVNTLGSKPLKRSAIRKQRKDNGPTEPIPDEPTNEEHVSTPSYDPSQSGEDRTATDRINEFMYYLQEKEDVSKQGRKIADLDDDDEQVSAANPVTITSEVVTTANVEVTTASAPTTTIDELTLA
ncbi:putative ribonuclease H-like domain-containing protein [Tanacetum coccineum]|uniref:Ribonuclease H-like domain-containing protein n=1 Tax=Tanacetum coccineum TaxID=301880 RepID=A0ABQ5H799_9ASTR